MNILGVKIKGHDTGAALITKDGRVVAIAEERLNRVKHSFNYFPRLSIDYCLKTAGLDKKDIELVVIDQIGDRQEIKMKEIFLDETKGHFSHARIEVINHHDAHAASAYFCSPFSEAAVLVYDGSGEKTKTRYGVYGSETDALYHGVGNSLILIQKTSHYRVGNRYPYTFGIGKLYSLISAFYLNFGPYNEGKMMGLAPYGDASFPEKYPLYHWFAESDGHIVANSDIRIPSSSNNFVNGLKRLYKTLRAILRQVASPIFRMLGGHSLDNPKIFSPIILPKPPRVKEALPDKYYSSVAYATQKVLERVAVAWGKKLKGITGSKNITVAGGVGLNIDANRLFLDEAGFENIFIQPAASDTGIALGLALYGAHVIAKRPRFFEMKNAALGRPYKEAEIRKALEDKSAEIEFRKMTDVGDETAALVEKGAIVGWFQGGAEYGPRALGQRSIISDARVKDMRDILNNKVKHREPWRPFAASVLRDKVSDFFELNIESPFMLLVAPVRAEKRSLVPSIVHIDGTCRIQSVTREANGRYFEMIEAFYKRTGTPLILNTSFNLGGEPIVESPADALSTFLRTNMDYLIIEEYLIRKK